MAGVIGIDQVKNWDEYTVDCNRATKCTVYNIRNTTLNVPSGVGDIGLMLTLVDRSNYTLVQIIFDSNGNLYFRSSWNGGSTWREWKEGTTSTQTL